MEAENNGTARANRVRYTECDWGDLIEGTKEQLQALGLGIGLAFPGEVGGPRIELKVRDPRGYPVRISNRHHNDDRYTAYLTFPNWPARPSSYQWAQTANGLKRREYTWFDLISKMIQPIEVAGSPYEPPNCDDPTIPSGGRDGAEHGAVPAGAVAPGVLRSVRVAAAV